MGRIVTVALALLLVLLLAVPLYADSPKVDWFLGYSFWRAVPITLSNRMAYLHGGSSSVAYSFNRHMALVADFAGYADGRLALVTPTGRRTVASSGSAYTYMLGPRFSFRGNRCFTPLFQALFGAAHASSVTISGCTGDPGCRPLVAQNAFAMMLGAGLDVKIGPHIALRLLEGDFLLTHFKNPSSIGGEDLGWQKNVRLSTGVVFRFD